MPILKIVLIAAALLAVVGQYLQEMRRLVVIKKLPGAQARDYYERTRQRNERLLLAGTVVLAAGAVAVTIYTFAWGR
jgi:hypothetical protein